MLETVEIILFVIVFILAMIFRKRIWWTKKWWKNTLIVILNIFVIRFLVSFFVGLIFAIVRRIKW